LLVELSEQLSVMGDSEGVAGPSSDPSPPVPLRKQHLHAIYRDPKLVKQIRKVAALVDGKGATNDGASDSEPAMRETVPRFAYPFYL
jgi:hypothetical protein